MKRSGSEEAEGENIKEVCIRIVILLVLLKL